MKKKTFLIALAVIVLGGAIMFGLLFGKFLRPKMSLARLQRMKPEYTGLVSVSRFHGGGMMGESYSNSIGYDENKKIIYMTKQSSAHYIPFFVNVYEVEDPDAMKKLDEFVAEYNLSVWNKVPLSEIEVLDGPSTSFNLNFKASEDQDYADFVNISYDRDYSAECFDVLSQFTTMMSSFPKTELEKYFEDHDGNKIYIGKDVMNTEEEIKEVTTGYFRNDENEAEIVFVDGNQGSFRIRGFNNDEVTDYETSEIIYEPYRDHDCSWYLKCVNEDNELIICMEYERMYVEDSEGNIYTLYRR